MSEIVPWIYGQAEDFPKKTGQFDLIVRRPEKRELKSRAPAPELPVQDFPARLAGETPEEWEERRREREIERERELERETRLKPYRKRTMKLLRRYMRVAIEIGRLPSLLGGEYFRTGVTAYSVVTFEDRAIFVHDMERCLAQMSEYGRQLIAKHVLQEFSLLETARILKIGERTIQRNVWMAVDDCSEILLRKGLMERAVSNREKTCQGGKSDEKNVSDC